MVSAMKKHLVLKSLIVAASAAALAIGCDPTSNRSQSGSAEDTNSVANKSQTQTSPSTGSASADQKSASAPDADNTANNTRDRGTNTLTAGDQGNSDSDRQITQRIRRQLTADNQLSTTAKNVKIITLDGKVTLRGPVNSSSEKSAIEKVAQQEAGASVDDQLEVKSNP
jgi:osmotically-inducible protein OsmY